MCLHSPLCKEEALVNMMKSINTVLHHPNYELGENDGFVAAKLHELFLKAVWEQKNMAECFKLGMVLLYELLSIHDLIEELSHIHLLEQKHKRLLNTAE